ncbi:MAG: tyrosine-type recombinase/integrase [Thermoleophilia bacterium]|nr:tyrosine-type recombinase/integrase [Thermoleophilia bacterium]
MHDLRHTVGSAGADAGLSTLMISKLLGHKQVSTAERYSHLSRGPVQDAADRVSGDLAAAMRGKSGKVVDMKEGRKRKAAKR